MFISSKVNNEINIKKKKYKKPSEYNTFVSKKMSELRSNGSKISPMDTMKEVAEHGEKIVQKIKLILILVVI